MVKIPTEKWRSCCRRSGWEAMVSFARITVFPGREIDYHEHHGETETYHIIAGEGVYSDNGAERAIHAGDTFFCDDGGGHGIRNTGADDLVFIALIIRK